MDKVSQKEIELLKQSMNCVFSKISQIQLLDDKVVPEGLKPIARSISWIMEQVIVQNLRMYGMKCNIENVIDPPHNLTQYDCIIKLNGNEREFYVNLKTSLTSTSHSSKFDISKAPKLIQFYNDNPDITLLGAVVKVEFEKLTIKIKDLIIFNVAWTPDVYYNRANHNLQSKCDGAFIQRTNKEFVSILENKLDDAGHKTHY